MRLLKRIKKRWQEFKKERQKKKADRTPLQAVIYLSPQEHALPEMTTELALHGVKISHYKIPSIRQRKATVEVKKMPSKEAVEFARSRGITFKLKEKSKG